MTNLNKFLGIARIVLGFEFLWAFLDKTFGLGFATVAEKAWIAGGSPTAGFLSFGTKGPFKELFASLSGSNVIDIIFMLGLLGIGLALILGIKMRLATISATLMLGLMYLALILPENNPIVDDHIIAICLVWILYYSHAENYYGIKKS